MISYYNGFEDPDPPTLCRECETRPGYQYYGFDVLSICYSGSNIVFHYKCKQCDYDWNVYVPEELARAK